MAEVKKRFTELPNEATAVTDDLYTAVDSATNGTMKFRLSRLTGMMGDLAGLDTTDKSNLVAAINEVASSGGGGTGLTEDIKQALLQIAQKVAYIDEDGQDYYDDLYNAFYPPADLVSISAVYTQSGTVYDTDSLDDLKDDLVVTATYSDSTTQTVTTYTLSGTLTVGTSTITVSYGGKTTTFTVTVTSAPSYVTEGLIHQWDAINNTASGHDATANVWEDLVGTNDLTVNNFSNISWLDNAVQMNGITGTRFLGSEASTDASEKTIEIVFSTTTAQTYALCSMFHNSSNVNGAWGKICLYSDGTFGVKGQSDKTYTAPTIESFHSISASYDTATSVNAVYANATSATLSNNTHSLSTSSTNPSVGGSPNNFDYAYNGKIHAIRIYNKILTAEEVAQNYAVDVSRFGLGA